MNRILAVTIALAPCVYTGGDLSNAIHIAAPVKNPVIVTLLPTTKDLIRALIHVESGGNDSAIGDRGKAVGCLQIHPILVREVNRTLKRQGSNIRYSLEDRYSRTKSIQMFKIIIDTYKFMHFHSFMEYSEIIARRWNGGPRGDKKKATVKYWNKVKRHLQN